MNVKLTGYENKVLTVELAPNEEFYSEPGAMICCDDGITRTLLKQTNFLSAKFSGESTFICKYCNETMAPLSMILTSAFNSLLPIKIGISDNLIVRTGAYVASNNRITVSNRYSFKKTKSGMGLNFQQIQGDSTVFIDSTGNTTERTLGCNEVLFVDENHICGLLNIPDEQITPELRVKNIFHHEGLSVLKIKGPGTIYLSSMKLPSSEARSPIGCLVSLFIMILFGAIYFATLSFLT